MPYRPPPTTKKAPSPEDNRPGIPPQKPRKQSGRPPAPSEVSTGIKPSFTSPTAPKPTGPPIPVLQNFGVHLSIGDLNHRVQGIYDAFSEHFGRPPSPGHVFDVLRAPISDFKTLYDMVPPTRSAAVAKGAVAGQVKADPYEFLTEDPQTGEPIVSNPLLDKIRASIQARPDLSVPKTLAAAKKQYPTVQAGAVIPLETVKPSDLFDSMKRFDKWVGEGNLITHEGGIDEAQFRKLYQQALRDDPTGATGAASKLAHLHVDVRTIKQAQSELNEKMGTSLPATGFFNDDWQKALHNWMSSPTYYRQAAIYQAQQAGFGNDYAAFAKAWRFKQHAVKKHGFGQFFIAAMPLHIFAHGGGLGLASGVFDEVVRPNSLGFSTPLHALTHTAGLGFSTIGGTLSQGKAYAGAGSTFLDQISPLIGKGHSLDEAKAHFRETLLHKDPSWLRILFPDMEAHPKGKLGAIDAVANIAVDLVLLRKPAFTGERLAAGDRLGALKSPYLRASAHWAYQDLKAGKLGQAASRLEGGPGAERLTAHARKAVQSGQMSEDQFAQHLAELYANGQTTLKPLHRQGTVAARVLPVRTDAVTNYTSVALPLDEQARLMPKGSYLYHSTSADDLAQIRREGLRPGRSRKGEITGVYFGEDFAGIVSLRPGRLRRGDVIVRVGRDQVKTEVTDIFKPGSGFAEHVSRNAISPDRLEFLGADNQWHPLKDVADHEKEVPVSGPVLDSLRVKTLPTPGKPGRAWLQNKSALRTFFDRFDASLHRSQIPGSDTAANLVSTLRSEIAHAAPRTERSYFDPRLPERVHDYVLKEFKDASLANTLESELVHARAVENVTGIQKVEEKVHALYFKKYPDSKGAFDEDPFKATLVSEAPSRFSFPSGGMKEIETPLDALQNSAKQVNHGLVKLAILHARVILSGFPFLYTGGGMSLAWKHVVGDTLRRTVAEDGFVFGTSKALKDARREVQALADSNPKYSRLLGSFLHRAKLGETRWILARGSNTLKRDFQTGEKLGKGNYMAAAGGYLRRRLDDDALAAYQRSSEADLSPLTHLVLHNRHYQGLWKSARKSEPDLTADEYAQLLWNDYHQIEAAGHAAGLSDPLGDGLKVLQANRGGEADKALGKFIKENKLDFAVSKGQVERLGTFDRLTGDYIGFIMTANKWNRGQLAERTLHRVFHELRTAGWDPGPALETAASVSEKMVSYHMLDFANRLQVEQDLRWLSYFATKHRLYWKWVIGTFARHPGAAAAISDVRKQLDDRGNLNFSLFGKKLAIPAARLVWVPGREYSEVSPVALAAYGFVKGGPEGAINAAKGTFGNIFTRSDTGLQLLGKAVGMNVGKVPQTYGAALQGLDDQSKARVAKSINDYQNEFFQEHGHYAPEADAVKHVLLLSGAEELWRANLPLPITPQYEPNEGQKLLQKFLAINDPAKRRKFLDDNPTLETYFGVYRDPSVYLHNREFWRAFNSSRDAFRNARRAIYEQAKTDGFTPGLRQQSRKAGDAFGDAFNRLLLRDAAQTGKLSEQGKELLNSKKSLAAIAVDDYMIKRGSWGSHLSVDPLADPRAVIHRLFPQIPGAELDRGVPGFSVKEARKELKLLRDPAYQETFGTGAEAQAEIKNRVRELLQFIDDFQAYPSDALGKVQKAYQLQHVNPYWSEAEKRYQRIQALPRERQDAAYAAFRAWRDSQDQPVEVNGIKFPSPARMAWAMLDPETRKNRLAKLAGADWAHLTDYEKQLLGKKVERGSSRGWAALELIKAALLGHEKVEGIKPLPAGQRKVGKDYERILARYVEKENGGEPVPGFYKDYLFAQEPVFRRLQFFHLVRGSRYHRNWNEVLDAARQMYAYRDNTTSAGLRDSWRDFVDTQIAPDLRKNPGFAREVSLFRSGKGPVSPTRKDAVLMATDFLYQLASH